MPSLFDLWGHVFFVSGLLSEACDSVIEHRVKPLNNHIVPEDFTESEDGGATEEDRVELRREYVHVGDAS